MQANTARRPMKSIVIFMCIDWWVKNLCPNIFQEYKTDSLEYHIA